LSSLLINCLAAPFGAMIEWMWMGTRLSFAQVICGLAILFGVGLALAPEHQVPIPPRRRVAGVLYGVLAGFGQGFGAVLSRMAYAVAAAAGQEVDGGTAAYQRVLGGLLIVAIPYAWLKLAERLAVDRPVRLARERDGSRTAWRWVLLNGLAGPTIGVALYQWALKTTPSGVVLPIIATTPLVVMPFTFLLEGDRPGARSLAGGLVAVAGVIALTLVR
jgi:drug/metabolite transporter (DMT)-like permease